MRRTLVALVCVFLASASFGSATSLAAAPGNASAPRLPHSAADWATFTPYEQTAALSWEKAEVQGLIATGQLKPDRIEVGSATTGTPDQAAGVAPLTTTAYGRCTLLRYNMPGGWFEAADGATYSSANVSWIDSGDSGRQDLLSKNWQPVSYFGSYLTNANVVHAGVPGDWTWAWEHPTYELQTYHTAYDLINGQRSYYLGPNAYCETWMSW